MLIERFKVSIYRLIDQRRGDDGVVLMAVLKKSKKNG
jgi:hypothetical protein